ncbi:DNA helicase B-like [Centroberyx affinis]|uniref:DNA helicase B-like n=1 Tax=Centroberyx affinis TaxID=166261 RepID=UPI003A5C5E7A
MSTARRARSAQELTLIGYILPEKKVSRVEDEAEESEEEEEEEEKQPDFLDMTEMNSVSSGGQMLQSSVPRKNKVEFQVLSGGTHQVEGGFALRSPWWEVTCSVRRQRDKLVVKGYPSYKLRSDLDREGWRPIVSLFLAACQIEPEFIAQFFEWLPKNTDVSICNLMEVLGEFSEGANAGVAQYIAARLPESVAGMQVHASCLYPNVMKYLPTLLPGQFVELLGNGKRRKTLPATQATQARQAALPTQQEDDEEEEEGVDLSSLAKLEEIITDDVWKLGFNYLVYKELKLVRCEAQLKAFVDCSLFHKIPELQRNALHVYEQLKKHCHGTGSTYMELKGLCDVLLPKMSDVQAWKAIHFLKEQGVVVRDKQRVALQNFKVYEMGIAECLRSLVEYEPWKIPLNAREVLCADAEKRLILESEQETTRHDENADSEGNPSVPDPTNISVPLAHGEEIPLIQSEANTHPVSSSESSEQRAGPGQAAADQVLPPIELDTDQVRAVEMICANPVTVISGKGGCGKTTVVCRVFKAAMRQHNCNQQEIKNACMDFENDTGGSQEWDYPPGSPSLLTQSEEKDEEEKEKDGSRPITNEMEILLTAPTGRAASLLTKKTGFKAYTLHQVLWSFMHKKEDENGHKKWMFQDVRVFVVDEGSLVCVQLLHSILTMLTKHAQLRKFILLGDIRQLPSIQPGNTLHDLFHSLGPGAIEMRTNHRAESQLIVENATLISEMGMRRRRYGPLKFDATVDLNESHSMPSADKKFILVRLPRDGSADGLQRAVKLLIDKAPGLKEDSTSQFIAFKRIDVALINELCCKHYSSHTTRNHKNKLLFQPGDKVCCTKNGYIQVEEKVDGENEEGGEERRGFMQSNTNHEQSQKKKKDKEQDKLRLCNGEIFFIREDRTVEGEPGSAGRRPRTKRYLTLNDGNGRVLKGDYRELQRECRLQHAWARTIHTFQGSESDTIVYVLQDGRAQNWKHVYTAVTRGKKRVYVVADDEGIASAIKRPVTQRQTRLGGLVKEALVNPCTAGQEQDSQPSGSQTPPNTPHKTVWCFRSQPSTPLSSHSPSRSQTSPAHSTPLLPKCLWKAKGVKEEDSEEENQPNGAAASPGNKRALSAEGLETPRKQLRMMSV